MTIESNGYKTAYNVEILPAVGPPRPTGKVISYPKQTEYKVGDRFYVDGYKLRAMNNYLNTDASGAAELRKKTSNQAYYVENKGDGKVALITTVVRSLETGSAFSILW